MNISAMKSICERWDTLIVNIQHFFFFKSLVINIRYYIAREVNLEIVAPLRVSIIHAKSICVGYITVKLHIK